ncbi:MAG: DUF5622 domain-containing protein [Sulfolobales archaeon]|nr:DUF5622 domain-containing protein [Sulfolobales archaeon]MCX8209162.1 DUF5622 domain-containing protein [Sulfolobales archaeon]MDW8010937.1 DUF5622 domain-containing protein [Sulfolobales archaeon]
MGLKKEKYVYIEIAPESFVKARVIKSRADDSPRKYRVVARATDRVPQTAKIVKLESLPEAVRREVIEQISR